MDASVLATLSRLLDEALDHPPEERSSWIENLGPEYESLKPRLRRLLTERVSFLGSGTVGTLPKLDITIDEHLDGDAGSGVAAGETVGPYRLVRMIAEGGMGSVWLAERADGLFNRPVALKLPRGAWRRPGLLDRVARERDILATLSHPHIARLYDAGVTPDGHPWLALEYVEGRAIDAWCRDGGVDVRTRIQLLQQVARGVSHAHAKLIIHRDLKPTNILVTAEGQVRLLDFGIAKLLEDGRTKDSTVTEVSGRALTPEYASPEQIAGAPLGVASDVYSLGVVSYELLTGVRPYRLRSGSRLALEEAILAADVRRPSEAAADPALRKQLRGDLDTILLRALTKDPEERYATVEAFAADLQRHLDRRPVLARPDSTAYRVQRFVERHRLGVAASIAIAAALLTGAGLATWQARVALAESERADQVAGFLTSMFRDVNPFEQGPDRSVSAIDLLTRAEGRLDQELADQPLVRAELLRVLGESYLALSDMKNAARVLERAVEESRSSMEPGDPARLEAELLLGDSEHYMGRTGEAAARIDDIVSRLEAAGRERTELYVRARLLQARFLINEGRFETDAAEQAALRARDAALAVLGPRHDVTARSYEFLATVYRWRGKPDLAVENSERSYELLLDLNGHDPKHPEVIQAQNTLGRALTAIGDFKRAVPHLETSAAGAEEILKGDVAVQQFLGTLANAQIEYGELEEALENLRRAFAMDLRGVVVSDAFEGGRAFTMGRALVSARRPLEGIPYLTDAVARFRKIGDTATRLLADAELGSAFIHAGRLDDAARVLEAVVAEGPPAARGTRMAMHRLGQLYRVRGEHERALDMLERARVATEGNPREGVTQGEVLTELALLAIARGEHDEAASRAERAVAVLAEVQGPMTPSRAEALAALGRAHLERNRPDQALVPLESADGFWRSFAVETPSAREAARLLTECRAALERPEDARATAERSTQEIEGA